MAEKYFLQNRWKLENKTLNYYGLRSGKNLFKNTVKLSAKEFRIISSLPKELDSFELKILNKFIGTQIVTEDKLIAVPKSLKENVLCLPQYQ